MQDENPIGVITFLFVIALMILSIISMSKLYKNGDFDVVEHCVLRAADLETAKQCVPERKE
jgi:hypothetical protein